MLNPDELIGQKKESMKKKNLNSYPVTNKSSEILIRDSEIGFMPLKLIKINSIVANETISVTNLPIFLIIQNLSQSHSVCVYAISRVFINPMLHDSECISINNENTKAWVNMNLEDGVLKITNRRANLGITVNCVGISLN